VRKPRQRKLKKAIAILGEGYTEWYYFDYIRTSRHYSFSLKPELPGPSDYTNIFRKARLLLRKSYDLVFCVLDVDTIARDNKQSEAFKKACTSLPKKIIPITSYPCIEMWFLLHFLEHSPGREYQSYDEIVPKLRNYLANYQKTQEYFKKHTPFERMEQHGGIERAISNAENILKAKQKDLSLFQRSYSEIGKILQQLEKCKDCSFKDDCLGCAERMMTVFSVTNKKGKK
jgi:hypothetical protein